MKPIPYFERDGSYNEREPIRTKPRQDFWLAFDTPISKQLKGQVSESDGVLLDQLNEARRTLLNAGCLPSRRGAAVEKQIVLRAQVFMRKFSRGLSTPHP